MGSQPSSPSSFQNSKDLKFVITLNSQRPQFSINGETFSTITLQGLRASVYIDNAGGAMMGTLRAQIFGVTESDMNSLTSPQWDITVTGPGASTFSFNQIQVFAIDGAQETLVYNGVIQNAWAVFTSMPNTYLLIEAIIGGDKLIAPSSPISISADTDVETLMSQIAKAMGYQFKNYGVKITVPKGDYYANTLMEQARQLMRSYKFWMYIDSTNPNTLAIAPYGSATETIAPLVSPETGLIGYPVFSYTGLNFETLFNPGITYGGLIHMKSSIPKANGPWIVVSMSHQLSSQMPGGMWKSTINAASQKVLGIYIGE